MKIVSKFQDYYDIAGGYGIDTELIYVRKTKTEIIQQFPEAPRKLFELMSLMNTWYSDIKTEALVIGFCGRYYPVLRVTESNIQLDSSAGYCNSHRSTTKIHNFYDTLSISGFFNKKKYEKIYNAWVKKYTSKELNNRWSTPFNKQIWDNVFNSVVESDSEFHKHNSPIIVYIFDERQPKDKSRTRIVNPCLTNYEFFKIADSWSAFQEISMYLGGVLGINEQPMVQISDEDMRDAKGHDNMSFKKYPTKKR